jgi:hypothetical protein
VRWGEQGALLAALNGKPVDWMEKVTDEQYRKS